MKFETKYNVGDKVEFYPSIFHIVILTGVITLVGATFHKNKTYIAYDITIGLEVYGVSEQDILGKVK